MAKKPKAGTALETIESIAAVAENASGLVPAENLSEEGSTGNSATPPVLDADGLSSQTPATPKDEEQSDGTNTSGESGDAASSAPAELVNPQPALTSTIGAATPEAEASASGPHSEAETFLMQGLVDGGFEHDGVSLSREEMTDIIAVAVKAAVEARRAQNVERRVFELTTAVRLDNVLTFDEAELTEGQHAELFAAGVVDAKWEDGL